MTDSVNCVAFFDPVIFDICFFFARGASTTARLPRDSAFRGSRVPHPLASARWLAATVCSVYSLCQAAFFALRVVLVFFFAGALAAGFFFAGDFAALAFCAGVGFD
jgi:hypothetical protein